MSTLTYQFLNLLIYPFTNKSLFVWIAGILSATWCISTVFSLIRGEYY